MNKPRTPSRQPRSLFLLRATATQIIIRASQNTRSSGISYQKVVLNGTSPPSWIACRTCAWPSSFLPIQWLNICVFFLSLCGDSFAEIINIPFKTDGDVTFVGFLVFIISINGCIFKFVNQKKKDVLKYFLNYFNGATFVFLWKFCMWITLLVTT